MRRLGRLNKQTQRRTILFLPRLCVCGGPNVGGVSRGSKGASPTDLGERSPGGPQGPERIHPVKRSLDLRITFKN
jgi:hypothetical protein